MGTIGRRRGGTPSSSPGGRTKLHRRSSPLFRAVRDLFAGRSVVLISHRFATVRLADHIYVLREGRLVEHGHHDQLMAIDGLSAELFTLQASAVGLREPEPFEDS